MDGQPKTTFIPKKPVQVSNSLPVSQKGKSGGGRKTTRVFSFIAFLVFIASIAALVGVFIYSFSLEKRIENQVASLQRTKNEFDENFISQATRLNARIDSSIELLDNHLSPSSIFSLLESYTLQTVSFVNFQFVDTKDGLIQVSGTGQASRFESIVLQSDAFGQSGLMRNVLFNDLASNIDTGNVGFSFSATLDPRVILYRNSLPESFDLNNNVEDN